MRYLLLAGAMILSTFSTSVEANERLRVHEIHNFVTTLNSAVNDRDTYHSRNVLESMISNQAIFKDNVNTHGYNQQRYLVNNHYYYQNYGYRYPYHQPYTNVGLSTLDKWQQISKLETKKRTIPGYAANFQITELKVDPLAQSAIVSVDFKEQSLAYMPGYAPHYYQHSNLNTNAKCEMHLGKRNNIVSLTRMYCNTSTNLPI